MYLSVGSYFINYHFLILSYTQMLKLYSGTIATLTNVEQVAHVVKRLPTMWEMQVRSLGWEDPLEKEMACHSSILAWEMPWAGEPGGLQFIQSQKS